MRRTLRYGAISAALCLAGPAHADADQDHARDRTFAMVGAGQQAYFIARLERLSDAIDEGERSRAVARGPAAFMRQDLDRVWLELNRILRLDGRLRAQQYASCDAMLSKIDRRLIAASLQRKPAPIPARLNRRTAGPASRAAF